MAAGPSKVIEMGNTTLSATPFKGSRVARVPTQKSTTRVSYALPLLGTFTFLNCPEGIVTTFGNSFTLPSFRVPMVVVPVVILRVTRGLVVAARDARHGVRQIISRRVIVEPAQSCLPTRIKDAHEVSVCHRYPSAVAQLQILDIGSAERRCRFQSTIGVVQLQRALGHIPTRFRPEQRVRSVLMDCFDIPDHGNFAQAVDRGPRELRHLFDAGQGAARTQPGEVPITHHNVRLRQSRR
jgi:hypothetical protein